MSKKEKSGKMEESKFSSPLPEDKSRTRNATIVLSKETPVSNTNSDDTFDKRRLPNSSSFRKDKSKSLAKTNSYIAPQSVKRDSSSIISEDSKTTTKTSGF
jgi:hypothetical protein